MAAPRPGGGRAALHVEAEVAAEGVLICASHHRAQALRGAIEGAGWRLRVHLDPAAALADIRERPYDALFCDERLKGATPSGFFTWHQRLAPDASFFVVATSGGELAAPLRGRPTHVLPFPLTADVVPPPPDRTQWRRREGSPIVPLEGDTSTVPLAHVVELVGLNDGSATVETPAGSVHLAKGRIEHASFAAGPDAEPLTGMRALSELIAAEDLAFKVLPYRLPRQRSINQPIMAALTEAARQRDESVRNRRLLTAVKERHPDARGLAIGYPLNPEPGDAWGDGAAPHTLLHRYAHATKGIAAIGKPSHLALEGEGVAWALAALRSGLVLTGVTAPGKSLTLLSAMVASVRAMATEGD